jgi:hypothetical protein
LATDSEYLIAPEWCPRAFASQSVTSYLPAKEGRGRDTVPGEKQRSSSGATRILHGMTHFRERNAAELSHSEMKINL